MASGKEHNNQLGRNLHHLRIINGEILSEVGNVVSLSGTTIKNYESGIRKPDPQTISLLAKHYGKTVDELLNSDLTELGKLNFSIGIQEYVEMWNTMFPIASSERALDNQDFKRAYEICRSMIDRFSRNEIVISAVWSEAVELFDKAFDEDELPEAAANSLWLLFLCWSQLIDSETQKSFESLLYKANKTPANKIIMKVRDKQDNSISAVRKDFLDDLGGEDMMIIKALKDDSEWAELGDYYLAMKYITGMVDSGFSQEINEAVGMQMMLSLAQLKNKFAIGFLRMAFDI